MTPSDNLTLDIINNSVSVTNNNSNDKQLGYYQGEKNSISNFNYKSHTRSITTSSSSSSQDPSSSSTMNQPSKRHHGNSRPRRPRKLKLEDDEEEIIKIQERIEFQKVLDNQLKEINPELIEPLPECKDKYRLKSPVLSKSRGDRNDHSDSEQEDEEVLEEEQYDCEDLETRKSSNQCMLILLQYQSFRSYVNYSEDEEKQNEQIQAQKMDRFQLMKKKRAIRREKRKSFKQKKTTVLNQMMMMQPNVASCSQVILAPVLFLSPPHAAMTDPTLENNNRNDVHSGSNLLHLPTMTTQNCNISNYNNGVDAQNINTAAYYSSMMTLNNNNINNYSSHSVHNSINNQQESLVGSEEEEEYVNNHPNIWMQQKKRHIEVEEPSAKRFKSSHTSFTPPFPQSSRQETILEMNPNGPSSTTSSTMQDEEEECQRLDSLFEDLLQESASSIHTVANLPSSCTPSSSSSPSCLNSDDPMTMMNCQKQSFPSLAMPLYLQQQQSWYNITSMDQQQQYYHVHQIQPMLNQQSVYRH